MPQSTPFNLDADRLWLLLARSEFGPVQSSKIMRVSVRSAIKHLERANDTLDKPIEERLTEKLLRTAASECKLVCVDMAVSETRDKHLAAEQSDAVVKTGYLPDLGITMEETLTQPTQLSKTWSDEKAINQAINDREADLKAEREARMKMKSRAKAA